MLQRLHPLETTITTPTMSDVVNNFIAATTPVVDYSCNFGNLKWLGDAGGSLRVRGARVELLPVRYGMFLSVGRTSMCPLSDDDPSVADELIDVVN